MGKYTVLMNNVTKRLVTTNKINLRQHESLVDKLFFICEFQYSEDIDLREFQCVLEWLDPTNVAHVDVLEQEEEIYKEKYQRYSLPIESPLNRYAGDIEVKLVFTKVDYETGKRYKLESDTTIIEIKSIKDYYAVLPNESFDAINDSIDKLKALTDELSSSAELYDKIKADNIGINEDGDVQLLSHSEFIGDAISVATPGTIDDEDGNKNGVIDLNYIYDDVIL